MISRTATAHEPQIQNMKKEPTAPFSFGKRACRETAEERHEATARIITLMHGGKSQVLRPGPVPLYAGSRLRQSSEVLSAKNGESDVLHPRQPRERTGTDVYTVSMQRRRKIRQSVRRRSSYASRIASTPRGSLYAWLAVSGGSFLQFAYSRECRPNLA